jgi:hypothetical protein
LLAKPDSRFRLAAEPVPLCAKSRSLTGLHPFSAPETTVAT